VVGEAAGGDDDEEAVAGGVEGVDDVGGVAEDFLEVGLEVVLGAEDGGGFVGLFEDGNGGVEDECGG
jgi:hypothetical protein